MGSVNIGPVTSPPGQQALRMRVFSLLAVGGETSATVSISTTQSLAAAFAVIYRCVDATTPFDGVTALATTSAASATYYSRTAITTATPNALVVSFVMGNTSVGANVATYVQRTSPAASYGTANGPQFVGVADIVKPTVGSQAGATWTAVSGTPLWAGRPASCCGSPDQPRGLTPTISTANVRRGPS